MRLAIAISLCAALASAACHAPAQHDAVAATGSGVSVPNDGLIPLTPAGDLGDWVKDIRRGIAKLPEVAKTDAPTAQRQAIQLYVSRQEYDEMYYGVDGRVHAPAALGKQIETAEEHFHVLMRLLGTKNPSPDAVQSAVDALDAQQAKVAKLWKKTGLHINRPTE
jgi:hypothetical protein